MTMIGRDIKEHGGSRGRGPAWRLAVCPTRTPIPALKLLLAVTLVFWAAGIALASPLGTDFTYQGKLDLSGSPVTGTADFQFKLFAAVSGGTQIGSTVAVNNVTVSDGTFSVSLDFGATAFEVGEERWLELVVRSPAGTGSFVTLAPRQEITASPFALEARGVDGHSLDAADGSPVDALAVDNAGNVGIGTATPAARLHVKGVEEGIRVQGPATGSTNAAWVGFNDAAGTRTGFVGDGSIHDNSTFLASDLGDVVLQTVAGRSLVVKPDGRVGIGTITPSMPLHINAEEPVLVLQDSGSASTQSGYIGFWNNNPSETAWAGFGTPGSPHFSVVNARVGGNIALSPGVGGVVSVPVLEITGADLAERFPTTDDVEPGMVVAIEDDDSGRLCLARGAYNHRVAGVVSGANDFSVGAVLGNLPGNEDAPAVALTGRCYVWCDASTSPIAAGDLLTTSDVPGHAMKASDLLRAQGAIIGKAMTGLESGRGMVLVLVNLQ